MKLFGPQVPSAIAPKDVSPLSDYWYMPFGYESKTGQNVTISGALAVSAVYAATRLISETVGMLPTFIYRRTTRGKEPDYRHPLFELLHDQPNEWQTAMEFKEMMTGHAVLQGNAYALKQPGPRGPVNTLTPLNPMRVEPVLTESGVEYRYTPKDGEKRIFDQSDIFHLRGFGDGVKGLSVIDLARESIGLALATEEHGARYFSNGAEVGGVLKHPNTLSKDAQERLKKGFDRKYSGSSNHYRTLVLEEGMEWEQLGMSNENSQFIESRKFQLGEIARWFRIPPHMLADLERATFSNIEQQSLEFVQYSILPWTTRWRQVIRRDLILAQQTFFADFKLEMLLRGDIKSRSEAYKVFINNGIMSPNEIRELENLNPREGGDEYWKPMNMAGPQGLPGEPGPPGKTGPTGPQGLSGEAQIGGLRIALANAAKIINKEITEIEEKALELAKDGEAWSRWVSTFYGRHVNHVCDYMCVGKDVAREYCDEQSTALIESGIGVMESWRTARVATLAGRAMEEGS